MKLENHISNKQIQLEIILNSKVGSNQGEKEEVVDDDKVNGSYSEKFKSKMEE